MRWIERGPSKDSSDAPSSRTQETVDDPHARLPDAGDVDQPAT